MIELDIPLHYILISGFDTTKTFSILIEYVIFIQNLIMDSLLDYCLLQTQNLIKIRSRKCVPSKCWTTSCQSTDI